MNVSQPVLNAAKIVIASIVIIILTMTIKNHIKITQTQPIQRENNYSHVKIVILDNIRDVPVENQAVQRNIVNVINQVYFVEIFANVLIVKIIKLSVIKKLFPI